jgi:hypothetical protein
MYNKTWTLTNKNMDLPGFDIVTLWQKPVGQRGWDERDIIAHLNTSTKAHMAQLQERTWQTDLDKLVTPGDTVLTITLDYRNKGIRWKDLKERLAAARARHRIEPVIDSVGRRSYGYG